jgi:Tfp pilus assembly protein PilX
MLKTLRNDQGTALVATLFFITALAITATVIVWVTGSERRVSHNEYTHARSFYASDAGAETAINWIRTQQIPPPIIDTEEKFVANEDEYQELLNDHADHKYKYDVRFDRVRFRPGWSREYLDFDYTIDSKGASVQESSTRIEVRTSRLFRQGY